MSSFYDSPFGLRLRYRIQHASDGGISIFDDKILIYQLFDSYCKGAITMTNEYIYLDNNATTPLDLSNLLTNGITYLYKHITSVYQIIESHFCMKSEL